jgi:predicted porin
MHKKLMALAVTGALAAPLAVQAQSTVQIYGVAEVEYGRVDQGNGRPTADYMESTGSYLGFKGTESLGGGLSAWFQCETTMDIRAFDQVGLCSRNSGLGFRGGFGNVWLGRWHTPFSRMTALGQVGVEATGILGFSRVYGQTGSASLAEGGTGNAGNTDRARFARRESCLTTYETPNMGGFMVGFAFSCGNAAADRSATSQGNNQKPRLWSTAATYNKGPLALGIGYEKHLDVGTFNTIGAAELDDRAWALSGRYTIGPVRLGAMYLDRKWENNATQDSKKKTYTLGAEWTIAGPHQLHFAYGSTGDTKGSATANAIGGTGGAGLPGSDTGYDAITLAYQYSFSKRTTAKLGWTRYDNDANSNSVRPYNAAASIGNGQSFDSWALVLKHRF